MEPFTLLKYWRTTTTTNVGHATTNADVTTSTTTTTIVSTATSQPSEIGDEEDDEQGPFFDLQFTLPEADEYEQQQQQEDEEECSDSSSGDSTEDINVSVSPSDDLFFNNGFVPVEQTDNKIRSKSLTKFRVMMLKLKNTKLNSKTETNQNTENTDSKEEKESEHVPHDSLFKRLNASKLKSQKKQQNDDASVSSSTDESKFSKEVMQRYLKKVKPLYVRVSKRYGDRLSLRPLTSPSPSPSLTGSLKTEKGLNKEIVEPLMLNSKVKEVKQGNIPAGLRVVCKQLRKSRSAFTAVAAAPTSVVSTNRRDDSLLQQQDGIQSAILHCKRSFKASRDSDSSSISGGDSGQPDGNSLSSVGAEGETGEINKR